MKPGRPQLFGSRSEHKVARLLSDHYGRSVKPQSYNGKFDLLVDGLHRIEIKAARRRKLGRNQTGWLFNVHRHGKLNEQCDFYILRLENVPFTKAPIHLLLRAPIGRACVTFSVRSLLACGSEYIADFYRFARGEMPAKERAA